MKGCLQAKGKNYYAVISDKGKKKWINLHISTEKGNKRKAEQAMNQVVNEFYNNRDVFNKVDFVEFAGKWLKYVKKNVDIITYEGYASCLEKHILPFFEPLKLKLQDITFKDIESYYNYKSVSGRLDGKSGGLSHRTISMHRIVLNLIFTYAEYNRLINENPCKIARMPMIELNKKENISFITPEECQNILDVTKGTILHDMIYITFIYGLRRSELMGLKWDAIDFENETVSIQHTVVIQRVVAKKDKTKNTNSNRKYPLTPETREIFKRLYDEQEKNKKLYKKDYVETGYVFVKENGEAYFPTYPSHQFAKVLKKNNMQHIRWHDLRHSTATMLHAIGWNVKDISEWLGHSSISTTLNIYTHVDMNRKKEISKDLHGLLN